MAGSAAKRRFQNRWLMTTTAGRPDGTGSRQRRPAAEQRPERSAHAEDVEVRRVDELGEDALGRAAEAAG